MIVNILVEGPTDEAVARRVIVHAGLQPGNTYGKRGIDYIRGRIGSFNQAARGSLFLALVDFMDTGCDCPPEVVSRFLPKRNPNLLLRAVVPELEAWLLADSENMARFLSVPRSKIPSLPEDMQDAKMKLISIARASRSAEILYAFVPVAGSTARVGKLYASELIRFIKDFWDIESARQRSNSLDSCLQALQEIKK
jgi:hypothetical protein